METCEILARIFVAFLMIAIQHKTNAASSKRPNIVFVLADDLGYADVSWTDSRIYTPNLEALYNESLKLENYYVQHICTPSRAALMSGMYPFRMGLQSGVIRPDDPRYLPLEVSTLPDKLKSLGYRTAAVGKWHLGFCDRAAVPTRRGFDTFYGSYLGSTDHFTHRRRYHWLSGVDLRDNEAVAQNDMIYSTTLFSEHAVKVIQEHDKKDPLFLYLPYLAPHSPIQVPEKYIDINSDLGHFSGIRLRKAAMITALDEGIGNVTRALKDAGLWEDTIFIFSSDNGGHVETAGMNYPYRGQKGNLFEGGTRSVGFVHGKGLGNGNFKGLFHIVDWYPTLLKAATGKRAESGDESESDDQPRLGYSRGNQSEEASEGDVSANVVISQLEPSSESPKLNGIDQWENLLENRNSKREIVYNIDERTGRGAIRDERYKLIIGNTGKYDGWYRDMSDLNQISLSKLANAVEKPGFPDPVRNSAMLFDLENDPYEENDLSDTEPELLETMYRKLLKYKTSLVPATKQTSTDAADPANFGGVWSPGWCNVRREGASIGGVAAKFELIIFLPVLLCSLVGFQVLT